MDGRASMASLLLSVVVVAPCMRKVTCLPPEKKPTTPHAVVQVAPQAAITPAAPKPAAAHPCSIHTRAAHTRPSTGEHAG